MRKRLWSAALVFLIIGFVFLFIDLNKEESFTIIEKEANTLLSIESNKWLFPSYKRANLNIGGAIIVSKTGGEISYHELETGDRIMVDFRPVVLFSDPPVTGAWKITLLD
ncbi:hypothetical protein MM300_13705 [Evansella sp. LMS18]|uniref:hypothetical protein n=1 Tax=Evansella sp. LMS18 TaxID=2924033 RepID=UPI0020D0B727|nr:hypothetical protein [Evansella sp. LMS18]UTR08985.1 hypothetical protein MM300_13705 [Evansella sp. LMS18]